MAKDYIKRKSVYKLDGREDLKYILEILGGKLTVSGKVIHSGDKIRIKANKILHRSNEKTGDDDSVESIKALQSFIKRFPV